MIDDKDNNMNTAANTKFHYDALNTVLAKIESKPVFSHVSGCKTKGKADPSGTSTKSMT